MVLSAAFAVAFLCIALPRLSNAHDDADYRVLDDSFSELYGDNQEPNTRKALITKRQNVPWYSQPKQVPRVFRAPLSNPVQRSINPYWYVPQRPVVYQAIARGNTPARYRYQPLRVNVSPLPHWTMQRSRTMQYNPYPAYKNTPGVYATRPGLYNRGWTVSGKMVNANTATNSHTVSNSVLKAPGHTTTNTHVVNKHRTGGGVRRTIMPFRPIMPYNRYPYPYMSIRDLYARGKVSASAGVNAKASSGSSSASNSNSQSSSSSNGGSRTTNSAGGGGGGWGYGAGAGYGTGPGAWGIGYGGGGGGSSGYIPSGMKGMPGMSSGYPGIPSGFPGMPSGGFPGQGSKQNKGRFVGAMGTKGKNPTSAKQKPATAVKPNKGIDATLKAAKANKIKQQQLKYDAKQKLKFRIKQMKSFSAVAK